MDALDPQRPPDDDDEPIAALAEYREALPDDFADRVTNAVRRRETVAEIGDLSLRVLATSFIYMVGFLISAVMPSGGPDDNPRGGA